MRVVDITPDEWRVVPGFPFYEVSASGEVRSITALRKHGGYRSRMWRGRVLKQKRQGRYLSVGLYDDEGGYQLMRVHVIVALAFVPNPDGHKLVRHLDDVGTNNRWDNLAWGTHFDNAQDKCMLGNSGRALTLEDARCIKKALAETLRADQRRAPGELQRIANEWGVSKVIVNRIDTGKAWRHA